MISNYILQTFIIRKWTIVFIILFVILMGIGSPYPYVGIGFFLILMFFGIIGKCIIPESILISESTIAEQGLVQNQAYRLTVIIASGIGFSIIVWTISAYLFKSITYGTVLLLLILVFEIIKYYKSKRVYTSPPLHDKILLLSIMSIALGFYHYGLNEVIINNYYYNSFRWDLGIHVYNSAIIKNCGLPQLNMIGIPQYAPVCHVGLPVLLSGVSQITLTSLYQSSRIIAIIGYLLLSLGVLSLIKVEKYNSIIVVFASFSVLIWGSLNLPFDLALGNWSGVLDPYYRSAGKIGCASGSYYHNLPQLWSMVFAGVSFISYDKFAKYRNKHDLYLCTAYIVVSGLIKPSTAIILVPALLIIMVLGRIRLHQILVSIGIFVLGVLLFILPRFYSTPLADAGGGYTDISNSWQLLLFPDGLLFFIVKYLGKIGVVWIFAIPAFYYFIKKIRSGKEFQWYDYLAITLFGSFIFSGIMVEKNRNHGNQNWALSGFLTLAGPHVLLFVFDYVKSIYSSNKVNRLLKRTTAFVLILVCSLQVLSGMIYAIGYPKPSIKKVKRSKIEAIKSFNSSLEKTWSVAAFVEIDTTNQQAVLGYFENRITGVYTNWFKSFNPEFIDKWQVARDGDLSALEDIIQIFDAIIIYDDDIQIKEFLMKNGWMLNEINSQFHWELWLKHSKSF